ncbi:MAG: MDR family oxidoreductase [Ktedonobacterales bacterium]
MPNSSSNFFGLVVDQSDDQVIPSVQSLAIDQLPAGDVLISVSHSSLNYKDALALTGRNKVVRSYPMVPGIDLVGVVEESDSPYWKPGDQVILTGWGVGENRFGGYAEKARVRGEWLVRLPDGMEPRIAMALGTAGFTAMLSLMALEEHGFAPGNLEALVTGASGGVGSMAVALLARSGYRVVATTGRSESATYLEQLGAGEVLDRSLLAAPATSPLGSGRWGGAIDTVGGDTLAGVLRTLAPGASVAACGNVAGFALNTSVLPFILRGVNLLGINSFDAPIERRRMAWKRLAETLPADLIEQTMQIVKLSDLPAHSTRILEGMVRGRIVVDVRSG